MRSLIAAESPLAEDAGEAPGSLPPPAFAVTTAQGLVPLLQRLCRSMRRSLDTSGAALSLMSDEGSRGVAAASSHRFHELAELQYTTGEGPCLEAYQHHRPVLVPDLEAATVGWPGYASAALASGVKAVFAFPLQVGAVRLGVLETMADRPGSLGQERLDLGLTYAAVATDILLDGRLVTRDGDLTASVLSALSYRAEIHQAQGMTMVALDLSLTEALVLMRSYAFGHDVPLIDLARGILAGDIVLDVSGEGG